MTVLAARTLSHVPPAIRTPAYDRNGVTTGIVHIGVGNFHRAHQAVYLDSLLAQDPAARSFGLCGVSLLPQDRRIVGVLAGQDTLYTLLIRAPSGGTQARIVGSIVDHRFAPDDPESVLRLMASPQIKIITMTITEAGYFYSPGDDDIDVDHPDLLGDAQNPARPRTADSDLAEAASLTGLADGWPVPTEAFSQWVIEDRFPLGRPAWEAVGAELVDDVLPYELMKMRLLNAGHQAIAYPGKLLGHAYGHEAMSDPTIARLLTRYQRDEAVHTLRPIAGTDFDAYSATVRERFGNAQIADAVDRLTFQSSTMLSGYVLPVIRDLLDAGRDASAAIAVVACWARFLEGFDEQGHRYAIVDDRADDLRARAARHDHDLRAVIDDNPLFVGLRDRPAFVDAFTAILQDLRTRGVRHALDVLLERAPARRPSGT